MTADIPQEIIRKLVHIAMFYPDDTNSTWGHFDAVVRHYSQTAGGAVYKKETYAHLWREIGVQDPCCATRRLRRRLLLLAEEDGLCLLDGPQSSFL